MLLIYVYLHLSTKYPFVEKSFWGKIVCCLFSGKDIWLDASGFIMMETKCMYIITCDSR
uniref:Uncharacterized protein n=1 Tax=Anguilla anguilla TaxID=7936 RepID=A0A0E9WKY0_ANGAN